MGLFRKKHKGAYAGSVEAGALAQRALDFIAEGVMLIDESGLIQFANPAAAAMTGYDAPENITGLDYTLVIRLNDADGAPVEPQASDLYTGLKMNQRIYTRDYMLFSAQTEKRLAVALSVIPTGDSHDFRIVTFRDITRELQEENEQAEFISTASHEMRTPVASIEGYLGLALNPATATIDVRAQGYLTAAHTASQHLGRLFKDLLDVTKLDDKRLKAHLVPVDAVEAVKQLAMAHLSEAEKKKQQLTFGATEAKVLDKKVIEQKVYMAVDADFLREIVDNLVGNAIKYTPEGGKIWVNARGDGDKVLINVTDNGIGISSEDAGHIFQKFYRVDNSQTRQIGGTGLGLYLVKQRVEALKGRVWLESAFGQGTTFFVSLPRISESDYEKMLIAYENEKMVKQFSAPAMAEPVEAGVAKVEQAQAACPPDTLQAAQAESSWSGKHEPEPAQPQQPATTGPAPVQPQQPAAPAPTPTQPQQPATPAPAPVQPPQPQQPATQNPIAQNQPNGGNQQ